MSRAEELLKQINERIENLNIGDDPSNLYDPIHYIMKLGGKRLRPLLVLLSYELFSGDQSSGIIDPALAVEMFHNFTLMHDDIMDKAPLRRGKQTVHIKWDINTAMLSGDVMLVRTYDLFLKIQPDLLPEVIRKFNDCAAQVCEGQQLDMNFESEEKVTESDYLGMIKLKTAALIGFSMELGAWLGGADEKQALLMKEFGLNTGIGFQLKDDLLDVYADGSKFGKQRGGDIISNKKTYLLTKASELATGNLKAELNHWITTSEFNIQDKINAVTSIYDQLNIYETATLKIDDFFREGFMAFDKVDADEQRKNDLRTFVENLIDREN